MNKESQAYKRVKNSNRLILFLSLIGLAGVIVLSVISSIPYWMAQITGPIEISGKEISALDGSTHLYNRAVSGIDMDDTFYYEETIDEDTGRQVRIDAYFGALEVSEDVWILVRHPEEINTRQDDYVGTLQPIPSGVSREVAELSADEMRIDYLPVMLDTTKNEVMWYVGTLVLAITGLASIWGLFTFIQRNNDPSKHPILKRLARYGDPEIFISQVESELASSNTKIGKLNITENYLVNSAGIGFNAMPFDKVAWVYMMIVKGRYNTKTYQAHFKDVTGYEIMIAAKEKEVNQMLQAVASRAPWAIAGYSEDIKKTWNKDRPAFLAEVENRRRNLLS